MNFKKSISLVLTLCMVFSLFATFVFPAAAEEGSVTIEFRDTTNRVSQDTESQVWSANGITVTGNKADSTTDVANYSNPARFYKSSTVTVEYPGMTKIVIDAPTASSGKYLNPWVNSLNDANATATVDGSYVTIEFAEAVDTFTIALTAGQARAYEMTVYYAIEEEPAPAVTSQVVTDWNVSDWNNSANGANGAYIFTDADVYATSTHTWWFHAAFAPTDVEGVYEVTAVRAPSTADLLTIPENGFVWAAHDTAAEGTAGAYSVAVISNVAVGNKVTFTGLDIANQTTTEDATAEKVVEEIPVDPNAPVSIALGKTYTYPTDGLYFHWSDEWPCTDNVATALTDGVKVAGYYGMGETSGWGGASPNPLEVVIDLEAVYSIDSFAYTVCGGVDGISMPASVAIYVSEDGENFTQVDVAIVDGDITCPIGWTTCGDRTSVATAAAPVNGRYVKFAFTKEGNFVFINELEVFGEEATVAPEEDDESFKETYIHVDGETVGTTQSRGEGWEALLIPDFWYVVEDGATEVTIKVAVDNRKVAVDDTMLRVWIDADPSDTARTTLVDTKVKDGAAYVARVDGGFDAAILSQTYSVIGNDYYITVVLDKAALGIDGQYGMMLTLSETGYNSMHNVAWDVEDVAGAAPWNTTKDYILYGEEPAPEYDEGWNIVFNEDEVKYHRDEASTEAGIGDGIWGEDSASFGDTDVYLFWNKIPTNGEINPTIDYIYNAGAAIDVNTVKFGLFADAGSMVGYPELVGVAYSVDGIEWTDVAYTGSLPVAEHTVGGAAANTFGYASAEIALSETVNAQYIRVTVQFPNSPFTVENGYDEPVEGAGNPAKPVWEFFGMTEIEVSYVAPAAPEYDLGWNVEYDAEQLNPLKGNEATVNGLGDGNWVEGATAFGTEGILLIQNLACRNPELYPEFAIIYNAGEAIDLNNIKVGLYAETNSMIGFPSKDAKVYVSNDGIEWTLVESTNDIPESVFVQHHDPSNSLGTYIVDIKLAEDAKAQYVKVVFTYTDSPFNDPNGDYKPVYEFIGFTEAEVSYVEPAEELPEDATGLDIFGYTHAFLNYVMYVDADMTLGELTAKYYGQSKDLNYFKVIVVNADGTVAATYLELDRNTNPASVKTDIAVTAGQVVIALSANEANVGRHEIADTVNVGDIVTFYNVDFTAANNTELTNAGFTVEAAPAPKLESGVYQEGDLLSQWGAGANFDVLFNRYTGVGEIVGHENGRDQLFGISNSVMDATNYVIVLNIAETTFDTVTLYALDYVNGGVTLPASVVVVIDGVEYTAVVNTNINGIATIVADLGDDVTADYIEIYVEMAASPVSFPIFHMYTEITLTDENAPLEDLPSGRGFPVLVPANGSVSYKANFENGADFMLFDTSVTVLVNGVALDASEGYYETKLEKGDVVTFENATEEDITVYPMAFPVVFGTMSNPFVLEEIGDLTADITMDLIMDGGAAHYLYTAPANGKVVVTMLDESWTYTVNNLTAGKYGDGQWSDSDPVLKSYSVDVAAGDEIQIIVGTYDAETPWAAPEGKVNFNVKFFEKQDVVDLKVSHQNLYNWGTYESMIICEAGKTVKDVIGQTPYWWIMYVVEEVDGVYVATEFYKNCDEINTTACPENGFLYYVYSSNSAWADADEGMLLGYIFNLNDIVLGEKYAIDTSKEDGIPFIMTAVNPDALKVGDVNMNGKIDANDYATIRKLVVGSVNAEDLSEKALELADVNGNGKIDANDYILVKRHFLGTYTIPAWEEAE